MRANFGRGMGRGSGPQMGIPVQKARDFKRTLFRLLKYLKPYRMRLAVVLIMSILSTAFSILCPKIIGNATTKLFEGAMQKINHVPGAAIDFHYLLDTVLLLAALYIVSSLFSYLQQYVMAGVAQKTVYELRKEVNDKLARLPLRFFDSRTNGEILSRVVNDVDNISSTLQQSLTQLVSSVVTFLGVIVMMLTISPLMTLVVFLTIPLSLIVTKWIAARSQKYFAGQQKELGELNGHVEEMYTGHMIVKAFGHEAKSVETFDRINEKLYQSSVKSQFISGIIMPLMRFISNIGYVFVCVVGGVLVTKRAIQIRYSGIYSICPAVFPTDYSVGQYLQYHSIYDCFCREGI